MFARAHCGDRVLVACVDDQLKAADTFQGQSVAAAHRLDGLTQGIVTSRPDRPVRCPQRTTTSASRCEGLNLKLRWNAGNAVGLYKLIQQLKVGI